MATEDVVIRLRVDDSALRKAEGRGGSRDFVIAGEAQRRNYDLLLDNPVLAEAAVAGAAGSYFSTSANIAGGIGTPTAALSPSKRRRADATIRNVISSSAIPTFDPVTVAETLDRSAVSDFDTKIGYVPNAFQFTGLDRAVFRWTRNFDTEMKAQQYRYNKRPGSVSGTAARQLELGHIVGSGGTLTPFGIPDSVFTDPLKPDTLNTGLTGPGIIKRTASKAQDFASSIAARPGYQNFMPSMLGGNAQKLTVFNNLSADSIKEAIGRFGVITSAVGMMAVAKQMSEARAEYFKKLMLTNEQPDPAYLNLGFKKMLSGIQETTGNLVVNTMFDVPSVLFEGLGIGRVVGAITGSSPSVVGMAIDMVGMDFKEALGLTEADYAKVADSQSAWRKAYKSLQEQTRAQAKRSSDDVAARMQGLGADGASLDELSRSIYKNVEKKMLIQADRNFNETNPFPTSRDVNPYGTDGDSGLVQAILWPNKAIAGLLFD